MTHLRKLMLEELERRNYAQTTIDCYIRTIEDFARHFHRPPDQHTPEHIREYQAFLFRERKLGRIHRDATTCGSAVLLHADDQESLERGRDPLSEEDAPLPSILSAEEVAHLIDSSQTLRSGKGRQDRDVMLSPTLLEALRDYWRGRKRKPTEWLFPGGSRHTSNGPIFPSRGMRANLPALKRNFRQGKLASMAT
jgi:integrase/recombinase XerD